MITLYYPELNAQIITWQEHLESTAVKHKLMLQQELAAPELNEGSEHITGPAPIENYLDKLEQFMESWYEDRCDKWEF